MLPQSNESAPTQIAPLPESESLDSTLPISPGPKAQMTTSTKTQSPKEATAQPSPKVITLNESSPIANATANATAKPSPKVISLNEPEPAANAKPGNYNTSIKFNNK